MNHSTKKLLHYREKILGIFRNHQPISGLAWWNFWSGKWLWLLVWSKIQRMIFLFKEWFLCIQRMIFLFNKWFLCIQRMTFMYSTNDFYAFNEWYLHIQWMTFTFQKWLMCIQRMVREIFITKLTFTKDMFISWATGVFTNVVVHRPSSHLYPSIVLLSLYPSIVLSSFHSAIYPPIIILP